MLIIKQNTLGECYALITLNSISYEKTHFYHFGERENSVQKNLPARKYADNSNVLFSLSPANVF